MSEILDIPEIQALARHSGLVRIPQEIDVPLTSRVGRLIDTAAFRRLARISQLGLVSLVYPAAHHTRFEHSLGVYRMTLLFVRQLGLEERFRTQVTTSEVESLIVAALLHDLGHWPFCHPIEDMKLPDVSHHEAFAREFLRDDDVVTALDEDWDVTPEDVEILLTGKPMNPGHKILQSILSGPIDVDKMDYLMRDSLHAGVPYGRNFDQQRLIGSLTLNESADGLAITDKGKTAAELMVFARYVMFSEVYWHHAVRSATAMLQRAFYMLHRNLNLDLLFRMTESDFIDCCLAQAKDTSSESLLQGLFGATRCLYKRVSEYSCFQHGDIYAQLARLPYPQLVTCGDKLAAILQERMSCPVAAHMVLIDAPPVKREIEFNIEVYFSKEQCYRQLGEVSPVVKTLAHQQFDDYVKRVRVFMHPSLADNCRQISDFDDLVLEAANSTLENEASSTARSGDQTVA
ncbi:MAG: HD domain-containing protein [Pirellulaceae bacterium]|nr:HD domain-containing protein [Pirellulaceae bacterium]